MLFLKAEAFNFQHHGQQMIHGLQQRERRNNGGKSMARSS
ncbi:hypothetical protein LK337_1178 [Lactococcus lactis subsp. lactis]|nr:hypothetical protein LK337_1178 [Lactococcus lactis subsp. lactis]